MQKALLSVTALLFVSSSVVACGGVGPDEEETTDENAAVEPVEDAEHVAEAQQAICTPYYGVYSNNGPNSLGEYYTNQYTTSTGCGHLNVANYFNYCVYAYIRYYKSDGTTFTSGPAVPVCYNQYVSFSNDVLAGTKFRVFTSANTRVSLDI